MTRDAARPEVAEAADFWSRRKAAVRREAKDAREAARQAEAAERDAALADRPDAEILAVLNLPDPDDLKPGDSIAGFMHKAVPVRLRRRALRALWRSNPALANLDALVDYGEDYTDAARVVADLQTAYEVGRGIVRHVAESATSEPPAAACTPAPSPPPQPKASAAEAEARDIRPATAKDKRDNLADGDVTVPDEDGGSVPPEPQGFDAPAMRQRRMRFAFPDQAPDEERS